MVASVYLSVRSSADALKIKVVGQTVQMLERSQTGGQTDRHYQTYYLPCFTVDNNAKMFKTEKIYGDICGIMDIYTSILRSYS